MVCVVYGLFSTRDGHLRYVGQTVKTLEHRLSRHLDRAGRGSRSHLSCWLRKERADGWEVRAEALIANAVWNDDEISQIRLYRSLGVSLLNATSGGDGCLGYRHDEEARQKMSATHAGKPVAMTAKRKAALALTVRLMHTPEANAKRSATMLGVKKSAESIAKRTATRIANGSYAR